MPAANIYKGSKELPIDSMAELFFMAAKASLQKTMVSYGFSQTAVENLEINLKQYTLSISEEEGRNGAFHVYGDGTPFYELQIKAPGSMFDMSYADGTHPSKMDDKNQTLTLYFEIAMNLTSSVGKALNFLYGLPENCASGGGGGPVALAEFSTTFRCEPSLYMNALEQLVIMRLDMIAPKQASTPAPAIKKNDGGPRL